MGAISGLVSDSHDIRFREWAVAWRVLSGAVACLIGLMQCACCVISGLVSGSADHDIKFWEWQVMVEEGSGSRQLSLVHTRTLKMTDDVLCIRISPDGKLRVCHEPEDPQDES